MEATDSPDLNKPYDPRPVEERWYKFWEANGVFEASDSPSDTRPVYVIPMPPPNVTGSLHMGHAQRCTLEDALTRYHRMLGFNALWQPGIDHAGIATQTVVERLLLREGKTRHDLGREAFEKRVWQWKAESGGRIQEQLRVLGASPDWKRSKFTMDPSMNLAVREAFVRLYEAGLMYRATRLINWCPECRTALSDLEVENEEGANGELFEFAYKVEGSGEEIVVATTRPETMLGDTAVAVHPDDPRYKSLHKKSLVHPFANRTIPLITDAILVDPKFGTGAVKVTPAHDFNDFATGKRHKLEEINIFNLDGTVNENGGQFAGLDRKRARTAVKHALDEKGLARGSKPHTLTLPRCQRSGGIVEPMISTQWFLKMADMAKEALSAVHSGETKIIPEEWVKTYDHFLENIQDWCVSRQLWWGHQIPAWHGPNGEIRVGREKPADLDDRWTQDPDVLDTWFSSALWPFSTLGWPDNTPALQKFYPASDLETGYDILFFWVARMMMFGLYFMKKVPFRRILLSGLIVDETGEKMSKVKGNVIDPLDLIHGTTFTDMVHKTVSGASEAEALARFKKAYPSAAQMGAGFPAFGADAVRFTLSTYPPSNKRILLAPKRIEGNRHFLNKIWNATRLSLELLDNYQSSNPISKPKNFYNRWILSRFGHTVRAVHHGFENFRIDESANESYRFFWNEFCDWYLEIAKTILRDSNEPADLEPSSIALNKQSPNKGAHDREVGARIEASPIGASIGHHPAEATVDLVNETKATLARVLEASLRLLHPMMPFITEELWQRVPKVGKPPSGLPLGKPGPCVALAPYPRAEEFPVDDAVDKQMETLKAVVVAARTIRSEHEVHPAAEVPLTVRAESDATLKFLKERQAQILFLVKTAKTGPNFGKIGGPRPPGSTVNFVPTAEGSVEVIVGLKGLVTADKERDRIARELKKLEKEIAAIDKKLASPGFVDRAPKEVVDEARTQRVAMNDAKSRLEQARALADELE